MFDGWWWRVVWGDGLWVAGLESGSSGGGDGGSFRDAGVDGSGFVKVGYAVLCI